MATSKFLIFDVGASNGRATVACFDGNKFTMDVIYRFDNIPVYATGTLYWDFLKLFSELKTGLSISSRKFKNIRSLAIDTWGADFGFIDKKGKLISNPIHYRDKKRNSINDKVYKIISKEKLFKLTGSPLLSYGSIFNLYSLKIQDSVEYLNSFKFLMIPDLFNYFLTGNTFNEYTNALGTSLCSPFNKKWEYKIINKLSFKRDIFCEILQPGSKVGVLQKDILDELEVKSTTVIAPASHDTASAIAGIPLLDLSKNKACISIGTWGVVIKIIKEPNVTKEIFESGYANEAGGEDEILLFKNFIGLWLIQQCHNNWIKGNGKDISWDEIMNSALNTHSVGSFIDVDADVFMLSQPDMPKTIMEFCRDKGQKIPETIGEVARIIYESIVLKIKQNLKILEKITGKKLDFIQMVGGGTKDVLLCQWVADSTGLPLFAGPTETTSIGNLLMQLKAVGEIKNLEEGRHISYNSSKIKKYTSVNTNLWDDLYLKFLKVL